MCIKIIFKLIKLDAKLDDLFMNKLKITGNCLLEDWTHICCIILGKFVNRSEKLIESRNISFSAKSI